MLSLVDDQGTILIDPGDGLPAGNQLAVETRVGTVYTLIAVNSNSGHSSKPRTVTVRAPAPVRPTVRPPPAPVNAAPTGVIVSWVPPATDGMMAEDVDTSAGRVKLANLSATDPDDSHHTFSLSGAAVFEIAGAALYLKQGVVLDYETQPRHGFTLTATDGGGLSVTGTEQTLAVTDANEAPTEVIVTWVPPATDGAIAEDVDTSAGPVKIAELSAVDPDADDSHVFSLSDTTVFEITGTALYLKQGVILDYETQPRHGVTLTATDGGGLSVTGTEQTLAVTDANEAPTEVMITWVPPATDGAIAEDVDTSAGPVQLAELSAVDPDADDSHVFSLSGADIFEITGAALYLKQGVGLDYETQSSYGFTLTATDSGGLSVTGTEQTLAVTNANEAPTEVIVTWVAPVTDGAIAENLDTRAGPVQVATLSATDPDAGDQHRFTLEGEQAAVFEVAGHALSLRQGVVLDRETHPAYPVTVVARDTAGLRVSTAVVLEVSAETDTRARARLKRVNRAILPALSRALVAGTLDAVERRIDSAGAATAPPAETLAGLLWGQAEALRAGRWAEVLGRSSFALRLDEGPPAGGLNTITLWGGGDYRRLSGGDDDRAGAADPVHWDGAVLSARLGLDARLRDDLLAGLALSWAKGEFDYTDRGAAGYLPIEGAHESRLLSVYPYVGWHPRAELGLWGALGYGVGEVRLRDAEAGRQAADSEQATAALGGRVRLFAGNSLVAGGATVLNLKGAWWGSRYEVEAAGLIEGLATDVWRLRLALEGSHAHPLAGGGTVTPSVALGLRHDGGDGVTGGGLEWGGGLVWFDPARGLRVEGYGRALLAHAGDIEEWGVGGLVVLTPGTDGRGLSLSLRPGWGVVDGLAGGQAGAGAVERLWARGSDVGGSGPGSPSRGVRWETELGYGLAAGGGLLTPYGGLVVDGGGRRYRLGGVFELGRALTLSLESARREGMFESPDHGLMLWLRYGLGGAGLATPARGLHGPHTLGRGPGWEQDSSAR